MNDSSSSVVSKFHENINVVQSMEHLSIDNSHHRTPSDVENNNDFDHSASTSGSLSVIKIKNDIKNDILEDNKTVIRDSDISVTNIDMSYDHSENDGFPNVIVNIINDDGNIDSKALIDEEYKDGLFSPKSPDSRPRTPRSKSNSLNSDQLMSHLR